MADRERLICSSSELVESGAGVRFVLRVDARTGFEQTGFAVRFRGAACGHVNRCPHQGTELDWQPGEFFEASGLFLVCSTHGALFTPDSGVCVAGPCRGARLEPLQLQEKEGQVFLVESPNNSIEAP